MADGKLTSAVGKRHIRHFLSECSPGSLELLDAQCPESYAAAVFANSHRSLQYGIRPLD